MGGQENKLQMLQFHKIKSYAWWFYPSVFSQFLWNFKFIFLRSHLASMDQEELNWNKFKITGKQCKKTMIDIISIEFLLLVWRFFSLQDVLVARSQERPLYSQTTNLKTYNRQQNELRHFTLNWAFCILTSKRGNTAFPPPSPPCNVVPMFELPTENNKHPNFEWRGRGGEWIFLFSEVTQFEYNVSTIIFCRRL